MRKQLEFGWGSLKFTHVRKMEWIPAFRTESIRQQRLTRDGRAEIHWSSSKLTYMYSLCCTVLQVGMHIWKLSPHLWRSSLLVTNDSCDCSTSGVGFGVVWKSVLALTRQHKLLTFWDISEEMGSNLKWNIFITTMKNARCVLALGSLNLTNSLHLIRYSHPAVYSLYTAEPINLIY